jgi:hypothetical protein
MRSSSPTRRRMVPAALLLLLSGVCPATLRADCDNLAGQTVLAGMMRAGHASQDDFRFYARAFNSNQKSDELNIGNNHTIGFLKSGQSYNIDFAAATADSTAVGCIQEVLEASIWWYDTLNCVRQPKGADSRTYVINTCASQVLWRSQTALRFPAIGFANSIRTRVRAVAFDNVEDAKDEGCFNVASANAQSACGD